MSAIYFPNPGPEAIAYESLWKLANPSGGDLSGAQAVAFFRKSDLEPAILKQIWSLSTPLATMNKDQFNVALRFITMAQNGDIPLSAERLGTLASKNYIATNNVPKFKDVSTAAPPTGGPTYAMTPEDHVKYFDLFQRYDIDKDGFITGAEAIPIFMQSGLSQPVLSAIWDIADDDKDTRLSAKEFCVAFHIIVCVGKRNLPQPTSLPPALKNFLLAAPMNPHAPGVSAPTPTPVPVPVPVSTTVAPMSSMPSPTRVSIESPRRQDSVNISSSGPDVSSDLAASVSTISAASQRALKTADGLVAASASSNTTLTQLIQKLAAEKISILAAIDAAEVDAQEKKKQLAFTIEEIRSLEGQLSDLRTQLDQKRATGHVSQGQLGEAVLQKQSLMNQITQARGEIAQLSNDISSVSMDVGKSEGLRAEVQDKSAALDKDKSSLAQEVGSLNGELAFLQSILASLQGDKDGRANELVRVQGQRSVSQQALQRERGTVDMKEKEVEVLRDQKKALTSQKQETLDAIAVKAASGTATVSSAAPVSAPVEAATPTPAPVVAPTKVIQVPDAVPTSVVADDFAASPAFDDFLPSTPAVTAPVHTISMPVDDFAPSTADSFEPSIMSPTAHEEPAFGDFSDFPEPTKVSFEEGTKEDVFPRPSNAPSRNVSSDTPGKSLVRMSSESSVLSVDPFDPFRPSKQRPGLSTSLQSNKSYIPKDVVVTHVEDDGDDFDGDFDKNPFESPFGSSSDSKALQAAAAANNGTKHESEAVDSGFSDDAFAPSSADDFAPSPAGSKLPPDQENTGNTGDFGFSGFDKNPFEDMPADVFGSSSTSFDAFGASPFDSFGDAPAATAGEKKTESGFDEW